MSWKTSLVKYIMIVEDVCLTLNVLLNYYYNW